LRARDRFVVARSVGDEHPTREQRVRMAANVGASFEER
jgi:hypothetical protein